MKIRRRQPPRKGIVLIAVLVVVTVLALAAYRFSEAMTAEYEAADSNMRLIQARMNVEAGVDEFAARVSHPDMATALGGTAWDNPAMFQGRLVRESDQARLRGRFSIIAPPEVDSITSGASGIRYGAVDEGGKININALMKLDRTGQIAHDVLMKLPNMTEELVSAMLDWIDADQTPRGSGAEDEYYTTLPHPYRAKNAPLDSFDELLYVKGFTPPLLYGNDLNHNGLLDPDEDDGSGAFEPGLSAYLTVYSRSVNVDSTGVARIYVNDQDLEGLYSKLVTAVGTDLANFIIAWRMYGGTAAATSSTTTTGGSGAGTSGTTTPATSQGATSSATTPTTTQTSAQPLARGQLNLGGSSGGRSQSSTSISSLYNLVNGTITIPSQGENQPAMVYPSPMSDVASIRQYLPSVLDKLTTQRDSELPARVNVTTAPAAVLEALPNMDEVTVQTIINNRPALNEAGDEIYKTPAWLLTEANLPPATLTSLERYITSRTQVYRIQVLGYFDGGGPTARVEAVIDANAGRPRIVAWRDLTDIGRGFLVPGGTSMPNAGSQ